MISKEQGKRRISIKLSVNDNCGLITCAFLVSGDGTHLNIVRLVFDLVSADRRGVC